MTAWNRNLRKKTIFLIISDLPRTNNVAEGWNNAFASMNGVKRPTIFKFIDHLKKDESLARAKIIVCLAGTKPTKRDQKYANHDAALKQSVINYINDEKTAKEAAEKAAKEAAEKAAKEAAEADEEIYTDDEITDDEKTDDLEVEDDSEQAGWRQARDDWSKSPAMTLLAAVSHNTRL